MFVVCLWRLLIWLLLNIGVWLSICLLWVLLVLVTWCGSVIAFWSVWLISCGCDLGCLLLVLVCCSFELAVSVVVYNSVVWFILLFNVSGLLWFASYLLVVYVFILFNCVDGGQWWIIVLFYCCCVEVWTCDCCLWLVWLFAVVCLCLFACWFGVVSDLLVWLLWDVVLLVCLCWLTLCCSFYCGFGIRLCYFI